MARDPNPYRSKVSKYGLVLNNSPDSEGPQLGRRHISRAPVSLAPVAGTGGVQNLKPKKKYKPKTKRYT